MTSPADSSHQPDAKLMAAVMAAVQAYVDEEALPSQEGGLARAQAPRMSRAWKMAAWRPVMDARFWRGLGWNGRA